MKIVFRLVLALGLLWALPSSQVYAEYTSVEGLQYWTQTTGKGKPVIVILTDNGQSISAWTDIIEQLKSIGTVFAYDRAGIGKIDQLSDVMSDRSAKDITTRLHKLLKAKQLAGPYIFVSYGLGSSSARYFARNFPQQTKGILLINPAVSAKIAFADTAKYQNSDKAKQSNFRKTYNINLHNIRMALHDLHHASGRQPFDDDNETLITTRLEALGEPVSEKQILASPKMPDIPVVVLDGKRISGLNMQAGEDIVTESKNGRYISESVKAEKLKDMPISEIKKIVKQMAL